MAKRFCTRCGGRLEPDDRFCGQCGQAVREASSDPDEATMAADVLAEEEAAEDEQDEDLLADWDFGLEDEDAAPSPPPAAPPPAPAPDQAPTQTIAVTPQPRDTAVLPVQPEQAPYEPEPAAVPPPGPAAAPAPAERRGGGFPVGATVALLGAVAVIVSSVLDWGQGELAGTLPRDIPARQLISPGAEATGVSMGIVLLVLGTIGALVALLTMAVPFLKFLRRLIGLVTMAVPVLYVVRVAIPLFADLRFGDVIGVLGAGFYFAAAGAFVQMVAGRWFGR